MSFIQSSIMDSKVLIANIIFFFFSFSFGDSFAQQPQTHCRSATGLLSSCRHNLSSSTCLEDSE